MLRLNAGFSRKVGEPDYGSRGASVNLEVELESHLVTDPDALTDRVRKLFQLAREAVNTELNGHWRGDNHRRQETSTLDRQPANRQGVRPATDAQVRAIRAIAGRLKLDAEEIATQAFGVPLEGLSLPDASALIDDLQAQLPANSESRPR